MTVILSGYTQNHPYFQQPAAELDNQGLKKPHAGTPTDQPLSQESPRDKVTISKAVAEARTREALGLPPTGPLRLENFKDAAQIQEKEISQALGAHLRTLDIDPKQDLTLFQDANNKVRIKERFTGKKDLESALNEDDTFSLTFKQLAANSQTLDYVDDLKIRQTSLADHMDTQSGYQDLFALASRYDQLRSSGTGLGSLLAASRQESPYSFVYKANG